MEKQTENAVKALLRDQDPAGMNRWLQNIQDNLILTGFVGDLTPAGREEFVSRFTALREFFSDLGENSRSDS